ADSQRQRSNESQDEFETVRNSANDLHILDGVIEPHSALVCWTETIAARQNLADFGYCLIVEQRIKHLPNDRRNISRVLELIGDGVRNECAVFIRPNSVI